VSAIKPRVFAAANTKAAQAPAPLIAAVPPADVLGRLAALKIAATPALKQQWRELFGAEPPYNRRFLESRLAYRVQEQAYGGLKPATIPAADLSPHNITQMPDPYRDVSSSTYKCAPSRRGFSPPLTTRRGPATKRT